MAIFLDGKTDNLTTAFLSSIQWCVAYNVLRGEAPDTPLFRTVIIGAQPDETGLLPTEGEFKIVSAPAAGNQETTLAWYTDEGRVRFRILSVTAPTNSKK